MEETATTPADLSAAAKPAEEWIWLVEPEGGGQWNMDRDEQIAADCAADGVPRLRCYSWSPWTLSLGYNQRLDQINVPQVERRGYGIVRRPTGGRAVFHAQEITYAVAMMGKGRGVHDTYAAINRALLRGFQILGAEGVQFNRLQPDFREHYATDESASCFSASALSELMWQGRKLAGSAQRRYGDVLLQHGSILIGDAHLEIVELLTAATDAPRQQRMREILRQRTATLSEVFGGAVPTFTELAHGLQQGFAEVFR